MLLLIANDAPLGPEWRDHELKGSWAHYRECHARIVGELLCRAPNRLHGVAARGVPRAKLAELLPSGPGFSDIALGVPA